MSAFIDLHSDTRTKPTEGMRAAIAGAQVGDEQADEDPTTLGLCSRVAELLGMEAGIFLPSGTMANLVSIFVHTRPGDELIADANSHIITTEASGAAALARCVIFSNRLPARHLRSKPVDRCDSPRQSHIAALGPSVC